MTKLEEITGTLLKQRHAHFVEASFSNLIMAWRSHYERAPKEGAERKEILVALGTLGGGRTPRDAERIGSLPGALLEPAQLEAMSHEIEALHTEIAATMNAGGAKG